MTTLQLILLGFALFAGGGVGAFLALYRLGTRRITYAESFYDKQRHLSDELDEVPELGDEIPRHEFESAFNSSYDQDAHIPEHLKHVEETEQAREEIDTDFSIDPNY